MAETLEEKLKRLNLLEKKIELKAQLPHLYGDPWYAWQFDFFNSYNHYNFLCAANQIGKSSVQIRKMIHWATEPSLWPKLWRKRPLTFWYLYPSKALATIEVQKKWVEEFLPRAAMKDHPQYGWRLEMKNKEVFAIHFNTGVSCYIKTYAQDPQDLQGGTVWAVFADEEIPFGLYPEINMRLSANSGYFHMVFTATIGQIEWEECIEHIGRSSERFSGAFKRQVSLYDCKSYLDGSLSHWTDDLIQQRINSCGSQAEVLRRIFGRFIRSEGLKYPSFSRERNYRPPSPVPPDWLIYTGVDVGSGGDKNHPAAICVVAVRPDFKKARVIRGWRGDGEETSAGDVFLKHQSLTRCLNPVERRYDWASKEFELISSRNGVSFLPADKSHASGEKILNVLFKNQILDIDDIEPLQPLGQELSSLAIDTPKTKAKDDFIDSLRYAVATIPWDWTVIGGELILNVDQSKKTQREQDAESWKKGFSETIDLGVEQELLEWGEMYDQY